jgi:ubiquinone/menaquinone biosynthesis C-methylase UbiE
MQLEHIDNGNNFDWGKTAENYAQYRDIYPTEFYEKLLQMGIGTKGQAVLDLGTGTGVLPRAMHKYGAKFVGVDISPQQIEYAKKLSQGMNIEYIASAVEAIELPDGIFDAVTALQCFWYFDKTAVLPVINRLLKTHGIFAEMAMFYLPYESEIAMQSDRLVLKYNLSWTGACWQRNALDLTEKQKVEFAKLGFNLAEIASFEVDLPFTQQSWHGRMKTVRGIGASNLSAQSIADWEEEHIAFLNTKPEMFMIPHLIKIHKFFRV